MRRWPGFTLVELLVVIAILAILMGLLLSSIQAARERRRASCFNNLKQFGIALHNYHDTLKTFPPAGSTVSPTNYDMYCSGFAMLLPFMEEQNLSSRYNFDVAWEDADASPQVVSSVIPMFICPSGSMNNPFIDSVIDNLIRLSDHSLAGSKGFGRTDYVFCKGITDAWCQNPQGVPITERGAFDLDWGVPLRRILDGTSNTFAVGEAAGGDKWPLSVPKTDLASRWTPFTRNGVPRVAYQAWVSGEPIEDFLLTAIPDAVVAAVAGCTLEPLNKTPVTPGVAMFGLLDKCHKSFPAAAGILAASVADGPHLTSNFRSDHPGGGNFLFADGSVHFIQETIDMLVYQQLSTIAGGEIAVVPE